MWAACVAGAGIGDVNTAGSVLPSSPSAGVRGAGAARASRQHGAAEAQNYNVTAVVESDIGGRAAQLTYHKTVSSIS